MDEAARVRLRCAIVLGSNLPGYSVVKVPILKSGNGS